MEYFHIITDARTGEITQVPFTSEEVIEYEKNAVAAKIENAEKQRAEAYRNESDPLFFKWQRGESTQQEWLDKVAEIKQRFPKVE